MGWTKRELISDAYGELALAGYDFDISPEELQAALRRLDAMMASWASQGLQIGYALSMTPSSSSLDADSGLQSIAVAAVYLGLAINIAGGKGKAVPQTTKSNFKAAYDALMSAVASQQVMEQQYKTGTPRGAGNKTWRTANQPFVTKPDTSPLQGGEDGGLAFIGKGD